MKLIEVSDIHSEHYDQNFKGLTDKLDHLPYADLAVLAGDIGSPFSTHDYGNAQFLRVLDYFCSKYPKVIFVPGNHDYWLSKSFLDAKEYFKSLSDTTFGNFETLINEGIEYQGKKIFGGPLWFHSSSDPYFFLKKKTWVDFHLIPNATLDEHDYLSEEFKFNFPKECDLVVSHHLPHNKSVHPNFAGSSTNCFFVNDCEQLILDSQPKLWIHGHTHTQCDYFINNTRIVCNPLGYPGKDPIENWISAIQILEI